MSIVNVVSQLHHWLEYPGLPFHLACEQAFLLWRESERRENARESALRTRVSRPKRDVLRLPQMEEVARRLHSTLLAEVSCSVGAGPS